jgi:hypothetical protein
LPQLWEENNILNLILSFNSFKVNSGRMIKRRGKEASGLKLKNSHQLSFLIREGDKNINTLILFRTAFLLI